jgi:hypothetical protein
MDEIELLRTVDADVSPGSVGAREAARRRLLSTAGSLAVDDRRSRRPRLVRRAALALGAVGFAVALLFSVAVWPVPFLPRSGPAAAASDILRRAADAAAAKTAPAATGYRHTKSTGAWLAFVMGGSGSASGSGSGQSPTYKYLRPVTREIWIAPDGSGRIAESVGEPTFFTEQDRAYFLAAGSTDPSAINHDFGPGELYYAANSDLPSDPLILRALLFARSLGNGNGVSVEMFVLVGDALRETVAEPKLRSALFEVASTIDGVEALGPTTDRAGRPAVAVGITGGPSGYRVQRVMLFDPSTYEFLGEEERTVETTEDGIPAGSVIGYNTYLASDVVATLP